jgi:hypothetical protein
MIDSEGPNSPSTIGAPPNRATTRLCKLELKSTRIFFPSMLNGAGRTVGQSRKATRHAAHLGFLDMSPSCRSIRFDVRVEYTSNSGNRNATILSVAFVKVNVNI